MSVGAFAYPGNDNDAPLVIKQVDFKPGCVCDHFGNGAFASCTNLETVIFPPKYHPVDALPFTLCSSLKILDFSNMTETITDEEINEDFFTGVPKNGYFIFKESQDNITRFLRFVSEELGYKKGWQPIIK